MVTLLRQVPVPLVLEPVTICDQFLHFLFCQLESANPASDSKEKETIAITIPVADRNLLRELVRRFGWVGVF